MAVETLATAFAVSPQTIRRDLGELCDAHLLARIHGGAVLESGIANIYYETRRGLAREAKAAIAEAVAQTIPQGASIFLGIGTTVEAVARALAGRRALMVVTNNFNVAQILADSPEAQIIVTGGQLRPSDGGLVGEVAAEAIARFRLDIAIVGISAIDGDGALLDFDLAEAVVTRAMLACARRRILVADATKFARSAPVRVAGLDAFEMIATDQALPPALATLAAREQTEVLLAPLAIEGGEAEESHAAE